MDSKFPEGSIKNIKGKCIVLRGDDIDTDRIIPARFLKCVSFKALGDQVFADDRIELNGLHPFDIPINKGSSILIVNKNFGCGSSREHAPQALMRWGIRGIIGESYAEIFYGNCLALGIPCAIVKEMELKQIQSLIEKNPYEQWVLDLENKSYRSSLKEIKIGIESGPCEMLLSGKWDATSQLLAQKTNINRVINELPYLNNFN